MIDSAASVAILTVSSLVRSLPPGDSVISIVDRPAPAQQTASVLENASVARSTWRIRLRVPAIARRIRPGQFVMLRPETGTDPLLSRPFALYDIVRDDSGEAIAIDIVYLVVGKMTALLAGLRAGDSLRVVGPLGNGFPDAGLPTRVEMVAGGIGQTPFYAWSRQLLGLEGYGGDAPRRLVETVRLWYGVRSAEFAAGLDDFRAAGLDPHVATDDGTLGYRGRVTQMLREAAPQGDLFGCGPAPMLHALADLAAEWQRPCRVSLETPMACGIGICFSCVVPISTADGPDYRRACLDGPVFDASEVCWRSM